MKISDYGLIGNSKTAALISKTGSIDWCCFPRFDSSSFFAKILDHEKGGTFAVTPTGVFNSRQVYTPDTNILETHFESGHGKAKLTDFFSVTSEANKKNTLWPDQEIVRMLVGIDGEIEFDLEFQPRSNFGKSALPIKKMGSWGFECQQGTNRLTFQTNLKSEIKNETKNQSTKLTSRFRVKAGETIYFTLSYCDESPAVIPPLQTCEARHKLTKQYWEGWINLCQYDGIYREHVRRSALTLKLLTFAASGAIIAAPTTSLPEEIGGERNWDYRFCWLRDASFTMKALVSLGYLDEAKSFMSWLLHSTRLTRPELQVLYSVYGESKLKEKNLNWLSGYLNSKPVRIGNQASDQVQLDIYGEVIDAFHTLAPHLDYIDKETEDMIKSMGDAVCKLWADPDEGIWEVRSGKAHHTHSKVMTWVALTKLIELSKTYSWKMDLESLDVRRNVIRDAVESKGYHKKIKSYVRSFDRPDVDASLLTMGLVDYTNPHAARFQNTIKAVQDKLSKHGLVFRYRSFDGLHGEEGSFSICNFWMSEALARAGKIEEAKMWFNEIIKRGNSLDLYSEELDPNSGDFLGNYPQAFVHIGIINAALAIDQASRKRIAI